MVWDFGDERVIKGEDGGGAAAFGAGGEVVLIGEEALEHGEEERAEAAAVWVGGLEPVEGEEA